MAQLDINSISKVMRDIDVCMMTTKAKNGRMESRPMSNNRQVDYNGDSYFFTHEHCSAATEIEADSQVNLSYIHPGANDGKSIYISITGDASLIRDKDEIKNHWVKDIETWFKDGIDTPGLVMIHVKARFIKHWQGFEECELVL